jgi:hypothetical protein
MKKDRTIYLMFKAMLNTSLKIRTVYKSFWIHLIRCYEYIMLSFPDDEITLDWQGYILWIEYLQHNKAEI